MAVKSWTNAEIDTLKKHWAAGRSGTDIAALIPGRSRNACIGMAHRLGLPRRDSGASQRPPRARPRPRSRSVWPKPPKPAKPYFFGDLSARTGLPTFGTRRPESLPPDHADDLARDPAGLVSLAELDKDGAQHCHWPIGEVGTPGFGFCGHPRTPGHPYCEPHMQRAYVGGVAKVQRNRVLEADVGFAETRAKREFA
jgi:GcrA cell cycle regulator